MNSPVPAVPRHGSLWVVLLAAAGSYALTTGVRQSMGLFVSPLNTATGLGIGSISLAFAFGQLWWGLTQPIAGAIADKVGAGRVLLRRCADGGAGHLHHALHDEHAGADRRRGRACRRWRRHGRAGGADACGHAADRAREARHRLRRGEHRQFLRPVPDRADRRHADAVLRLGQRDAGAGAGGAAVAARGLHSQGCACTARGRGAAQAERRRGHPGGAAQPATTCCSRPASSSAASTSPSWRRTCRA